MNALVINRLKQEELILALQPYINTQIQEFQNPPYTMKNSSNPLDYLSIPLRYPRYCPRCLAEDETAYFRDWWFFKPYMVCPTHRCLMLDSCPHCNFPIQFWNTLWNQAITVCSNCGRDISKDVIGIFELKDIAYYDILNEFFEEYHRVVKDTDYPQFFHQMWGLILSDDTNPWVKMINLNKTSLSSERLLQIILNSAKEWANHPTKSFPIEILDNIKTNKITLRDLENNAKQIPKEWDTEIIHKRINAITPLLKIQNRTAEDVKKRSNNTGISSKTLYNWMRQYREEGIAGLVPKNHNAGRRCITFPSDFEPVVQQHAVEEYLMSEQMTKIKTVYEKVHLDAQKVGIPDKVLTYNRLCKRIRQEKQKRELDF